MEYLTQVPGGPEITALAVLTRFGLIFLLAGIVGFQRHTSDQPAGLRTHLIIGLSAALVMMVSVSVPQRFGAGDPGRIAAQVVSGIGFLGGGAILKMGADVRGLNTAASLWGVAGVGLAVGAGFYVPAVALTVFLLITLIFVAAFQRRFLPKSMLKNIVVYTGSKKVRVGDLQAILDGLKLRTRSSSIQHSTQKQASQYRFMTYIPQDLDYEDLYNALSEVKGVYKIIIEDV